MYFIVTVDKNPIVFRSTSTLANLNINPKSNPNLNPSPNPLVMGHALCLLQYLTSVVRQSRFYP